MMENIVITVLSIWSIISTYSAIVMYRKVDQLEQWVDSTYGAVASTLESMRKIDSTGHFEADDEVGSIFDALNDTLKELNNITEE
jgi:hypothetical protein